MDGRNRNKCPVVMQTIGKQDKHDSGAKRVTLQISITCSVNLLITKRLNFGPNHFFVWICLSEKNQLYFALNPNLQHDRLSRNPCTYNFSNMHCKTGTWENISSCIIPFCMLDISRSHQCVCDANKTDISTKRERHEIIKHLSQTTTRNRR